MKTIFKGGYPAPAIDGLKTANCGSHIEVNGEVYEVMGQPTYSIHSSPCVSKYIRTPTGKVELSIWETKGKTTYGIAYYRTAYDTGSFRYTTKIPEKYQGIQDELKRVYKKIFKD